MRKFKIKKISYYNKLQNYGYMFVLPAVILFLIFLIYPMINSFILSFQEWNMIGQKTFVGLNNFRMLFADARFINSLKVTVVYVLVTVTLIMIISFWLAYALSIITKLRRFFQTTYFIPAILTLVGVVMGFRIILHNRGIVADITSALFGMDIPWLSSVKLANYTTAVITVWKVVGVYMMIFLAGFLNVPKVYYEAANIDGASFWGKLIYITIPGIKKTTVIVFISCVLITFSAFPIQYVMTKGTGGPSNSTEVLALYIYTTAFKYIKMGYASAMSVVYFLILLTFSFIQIRAIRTEID